MCCRQTSPEAKGGVAHTTGHAACCFCFGPVRMALVFLSTPSARRATGSCGRFHPWAAYFYPRPPRGGRQSILAEVPQWSDISIHALREEGDPAPVSFPSCSENFYPRPPRGGRPLASLTFLNLKRISIHALREEGDLVVRELLLIVSSISIHALREEGDMLKCETSESVLDFYPRPP